MQCNMKHTFGQWLFLHFIWITWNKRFFMIPMLHNIFVNILAYQNCNTPWNRICKNQKSWLKNMFFLITVIFWICLMLFHNPFIFDFYKLSIIFFCCMISFCRWGNVHKTQLHSIYLTFSIILSMLPFLHHLNLFFLLCWCFPFLKCLLVITFQFFWFSKYS